MAKSPLATVKERFGDKAGLIKAVEGLAKGDLWIDLVNADKGFGSVSNSKLLHMHDVLAAVKEQHGSRAKMIDAIAADAGRPKDSDFRSSLEGKSTIELFQIFNAGARRVANKAKKTAA